jgi:hypothetical protein
MKISLILLLLTSVVVTYGQTSVTTDTSFIAESVASSIRVYNKFIHGQELYYNGGAYVEPQRTGEEHSFYLSEDWIFGDLHFDGDFYTEVPLQYDIMIDQLVSESSTGSMQILPKEKVKFFVLRGKRFEFIDNKTVNNSLPRSGFYEILYDGGVRAVAQRQKYYEERVEQHEVNTYFDERNRFFLFKDGTYYPITSKGSLLKVLIDQRSQLRSFIRKNKLSILNREKMISEVGRQYDLLTSQKK